jgi:Uma2 family endonuclease
MSEPACLVPTFDELYAEIQRLPAGVTGEILRPGALRTMSRPGRAHGLAAKQCLRALAPFDRDVGGRGWWILSEPEVRLPGDLLTVPDLAGWRIERVPALPEENPLTVVPDFCCEILSPSTAADDRTLKLPLYARSGVAWVWLVDPAAHTVECFESVAGKPTLSLTARDSDSPVLPPFDATFPLAGWWLSG